MATVDPQVVSLLVTVGSEAVKEVIALVESKNGTATVQSTLEADKATIEQDLKTLSEEA